MRWTVLGAAIIALVGAAFFGVPRLLRELEAFRVERVAVVGTRYLAPHEVLAASGITERSSVFGDSECWRAALLEHPLVADARVERRLPGTIVLEITEPRPVAFVRTPVLRPVTRNGQVLPIEPARGAADLPIIGAPVPDAQPGRVVRDSVALALVAFADRVRRHAPRLADRVSQIRAGPNGSVRLVLREPMGAEALLDAGAGAYRFEQLRLVLADLAAEGELQRLRRIDARFREQVVVSLTPSA